MFTKRLTVVICIYSVISVFMITAPLKFFENLPKTWLMALYVAVIDLPI